MHSFVLGPVHEKHDASASSEADSDRDNSDGSSKHSEVAPMDKEDADRTPLESEAEVDEFVHDPFDVPHAPPLDAAAEIPDPIELVKPDWTLGVECAELATRSSSICILCNAPIMKGTVRLKYWQYKSVARFIRPACVDGVPAVHKAHSLATLTYQRHFGVGPKHDACQRHRGCRGKAGLIVVSIPKNNNPIATTN